MDDPHGHNPDEGINKDALEAREEIIEQIAQEETDIEEQRRQNDREDR